MAKGGSKVATGLISFFLGFLFAIIVEFAALAIGGMVLVNTKVNKALGFVGLDNSESQYVYDPNGDLTILGLFNNVKDNLLSDDTGKFDVSAIAGKSFNEINEVLPLVKNLVLKKVYDIVDPYIELNKEKLEAAPFAGGKDIDGDGEEDSLFSVLEESLMSIKTATFAKFFDIDKEGGEDSVVKSLLMGAETEYAAVIGHESYAAREGAPKYNGLPVMYDIYTPGSVGYYRKTTQQPFPDNEGYLSTDYLCSTAVDDEYRLYFVPCRIVDGTISPAEYTIGSYKYTNVNQNNKIYYFDYVDFAADTKFVAVKPDADGNFSINAQEMFENANWEASYLYNASYARDYFYIEPITEQLGEITQTTGATLYTYSGLNFYRTPDGTLVQLKAITVRDLMNDTYAPLYGTSIASVLGGDNEFVGKVFGKTSLGALLDRKVDLKKMIDDLELSVFISNVEPSNTLMANIVYKLSDVKATEEEGVWQGVYDKGGVAQQTAKIYVTDGAISKVTSTAGTVLEGAKVSTISSLADDITVNVLMDVKVDDAIMMYLGYGITGVYKQHGEIAYEDDDNNAHTFTYDYVGTYNIKSGARDGIYEKTCYISIKDIETDPISKLIDRAYILEAPKKISSVPETRVNEISSRVDSIMDHLTLPDFLDIDPTDSITAYVGYKISGIEKAADGAEIEGEAYGYTGTYCTGEKTGEGEAEHEIKYNCYLTAEEKEGGLKIASAWYYLDGEKIRIRGTKVEEVPDAIEGMKDNVTLKEIIDIDENDPETSQILKALKDTTISGLNSKINVLTVDDIFTGEEIEKSAVLRQLRGVKVTKLAEAIDETLIQRIYSKEVYGFPSDDDPLEMVPYDSNAFHYVIEESLVDGVKTYTYVAYKGEAYSDNGTPSDPSDDTGLGVVTLNEFINRGKREFFVREQSGVDEENNPVYVYKIVGYRIVGTAGSYTVANNREGWLYYEYKEGKFELCDKNVPAGATGSDRYDVLGNLTAADIEETINQETGEVMTKHYTYGEAYGMWRLVLYKKVELDGEQVLIEKAYTLNNFNNMVAVCATNIYNATLKERADAGVITADISGKTFHYTSGGVPQSVALESITLKQLIDIVLGMSTSS